MLKRGGRRNFVGGRLLRGRSSNPPPLKFWPEKKRTNWRRYVALWSAAALLGTAYGAGWLDDLSKSRSEPVALIEDAQAIAKPVAPMDVGTFFTDATPVDASHVAAPAVEASPAVHFSLCHIGGGQNCVVDGDTIWFNGQKIRLADIDTPETHDP